MAASSKNHAEVVFSLCAGSNLVKGQLTFSSDSKYLFCCSGSVIRVFNTENGQCAHQLQGHKGVVTGLALNPVNKLQLFSCGLDGVINQWDFSYGVLLKSHTFFMKLYGLVFIDSSASFASVIAMRPKASQCCIAKLPLVKKACTKGKDLTPDAKSHEADKDKLGNGGKSPTKTDTCILIPLASHDFRTASQGCNGEYIVSVHGHELTAYSYQKKSVIKLTTDKSNPFTCVACHPVECCVAAGHKDGKITMWWNFFSKKEMVTAFVHWHSLPVLSLTFTPEGSYLLSGGHECVLVKWMMNSDTKDFLPRLGAPIHSIVTSPDGTLYVTGHSDNVLQLIANWRVQLAIRGLARAYLGTQQVQYPIPVGLLCDPRSQALVTNGRPGHLQFYCMSTDTQLYNLDIVNQNYISPESLKTPLPVTEVKQAAFDTTGDWLATFESWDDGQITAEYRIKFWSFDRKKQNYQLNTTIESPHKKAVCCLRFRPPVQSQAPIMVSTSADGFFKLWILVSETYGTKQVERWTCDSVGYYRDRPAGIARFSEDGSLLAVAFQRTMTLWEPDSMVMKTTLVSPTCQENIKFLEFGGKTCSHFIVTATDSELTVWNLITLSVHIKMSINTAVMVSDGDLMAVVTTNQDLLVFRPNQCKALFKQERVLRKRVVGAVLLPQVLCGRSQSTGEVLDWQQQSRLYLMDSDQQLYTPEYRDDVISRKQKKPNARVELRQALPVTPFSGILGGTKGREQPPSNAMTKRPPGTVWHHQSSKLIDVLNPPAQPFHLICGQFIESLLLKNKSCEEPMEQEQESDEDLQDNDASSKATDSS